MKKFFLFASAALVLASCSSEAEEAVIKPNETPEEEVADLVEIKIGGSRASASTEASTRAANVIDDFNDTKIGIFAVDEGTEDPFAVGKVADNNDKAWASNGITAAATVILNNIPATASAPTSGAGSGNLSEITLATGGSENYPTSWYYPRNSNDYNYTFFGYYPYNPTASINSNDDVIEINGTFDGSQDVMIGKAVSVSDGYNAKWYRNNQSPTPAKPNIVFKHQTAQIILQFKKGEGTNTEDNYVVEAYFMEPKSYTMKIARNMATSIEWTSNSGDSVKAYAVGEPFATQKAYPKDAVVSFNDELYKINNNVDASNTQSAAQVGTKITVGGVKPADVDRGESLENYPVFVSAQENPQNILYVKLKDGTITPVTINCPDMTANKFKPGYKYTVVLTIHGPQAIEATASVTPWENGGSVEDVEI